MNVLENQLLNSLNNDNTENILKNLNLILNYDNYPEYLDVKHLINDKSYIIVNLKSLGENKYEVLYYNNTLPLSENTLISFQDLNVNGYIYKSEIVYKEQYISYNETLSCKCQGFYNKSLFQNIIYNPCKPTCKNLLRNKYKIR